MITSKLYQTLWCGIIFLNKIDEALTKFKKLIPFFSLFLFFLRWILYVICYFCFYDSPRYFALIRACSLKHRIKGMFSILGKFWAFKSGTRVAGRVGSSHHFALCLRACALCYNASLSLRSSQMLEDFWSVADHFETLCI